MSRRENFVERIKNEIPEKETGTTQDAFLRGMKEQKEKEIKKEKLEEELELFDADKAADRLSEIQKILEEQAETLTEEDKDELLKEEKNLNDKIAELAMVAESLPPVKKGRGRPKAKVAIETKKPAKVEKAAEDLENMAKEGFKDGTYTEEDRDFLKGLAEKMKDKEMKDDKEIKKADKPEKDYWERVAESPKIFQEEAEYPAGKTEAEKETKEAPQKKGRKESAVKKKILEEISKEFEGKSVPNTLTEQLEAKKKELNELEYTLAEQQENYHKEYGEFSAHALFNRFFGGDEKIMLENSIEDMKKDRVEIIHEIERLEKEIWDEAAEQKHAKNKKNLIEQKIAESEKKPEKESNKKERKAKKTGEKEIGQMEDEIAEIKKELAHNIGGKEEQKIAKKLEKLLDKRDSAEKEHFMIEAEAIPFEKIEEKQNELLKELGGLEVVKGRFMDNKYSELEYRRKLEILNWKVGILGEKTGEILKKAENI